MCSRDVRPVPRASRTASRDLDTRHCELNEIQRELTASNENNFEEHESNVMYMS